MSIDLRGRSVSFYDDISSFPTIGSLKTLYVDRGSMQIYAWDGATYELIDNGGGGGSSITVVANYAALPPANTVTGQFYWCSASQGTRWLPGSLGGTYYPNGLYYSNGTSWEFVISPYQATQAEVDTGTNDDKFITPKTFNDSSQLASKFPNPIGTTSQYIRGDGSLANFPASTGGGASLSFYLNGSVSQGTFDGISFREMDRTPILGVGTDFTINANGYIQSFITDAGVPNLLEIPAGNWNFETYFSASSGGGSPSFYVELYKWDGATLTLIASNSTNPESITGGTAIDLYLSALAVPQTTLALTDRLAVRIYVTHSGRTIKLHTEDNHLSQIITTFSTGLTALNGLTTQVQNLAVGTSGTDFAISSVASTHTFNLPTASATNRGALSSADWTTFNDKASYTPRVQTVASSATVTAVSTNDIVTITAQAVGLTLANPTGAFVEGQSLIIRIKDDGTARSIAYGTNFREIGVTAPTTTTANRTTYLGCIYNSTDTKFDIVGVCTEA